MRLNFPARVAALANAFTSLLGDPDNDGDSEGISIAGSGGPTNTYHLVVDITAYIT